MNIQQILEQINGNFTVEKVKIRTDSDDIEYPKGIVIPRFVSICKRAADNSHIPLSVVGENYGIVQYKDAVSFLDELISEETIEFKYGYIIDQGAKMFLIVKGKEKINLGPNEYIESAFTISSSHDGTGSITISATPIYSILKSVITPFGNAQIKIKHKINAERRIAQSKIAIKKLFNYFNEHRDSFSDLTRVKVNEENAKLFFNSLVESNSVRAENIKDKLYDIFLTSPFTSKLSSCKGTLFGCFMAAVQYADLYKIIRKSKIRNSDEARILSSLDGEGARMKADALAFALTIMENGRVDL